MSKQSQSLAKTRDRRSNAGAKMAQLLDREEVVDDFYKTTYGGFEEEAEDNDYASSEDSDSGDEIDSDFSIDENDEPISDDNTEDNERRRQTKRKTNNSFNNKDIKAKNQTLDTKPNQKRSQQELDIKPKTSGGQLDNSTCTTRSGGVVRRSTTYVSPTKRCVTKKSFRESTRRNARETEHRIRVARKESEQRKLENSRRGKDEYRQLTQTEMLREAKKTEALNLKSLERYRKLELEKSKKSKIVKETPKGPYIRYQSVTMPLVQELPDCSDTTTAADNDNEESTTESSDKQCSEGQPKCSRTFISFTDDQTFEQYFPKRTAQQPKQKLFCPISHLPGRYFDPVTLLPYSSAATFRAIREAYYKQLEQLGDQRQPEVAKWIQWRKRTSAQRAQIPPRIIRIIK